MKGNEMTSLADRVKIGNRDACAMSLEAFGDTKEFRQKTEELICLIDLNRRQCSLTEYQMRRKRELQVWCSEAIARQTCKS